jgi:hypothetical protein
MDISFAPPQKTNDLYIVAENDTKDRKAIIPLNLNNPENTDLQFMPEGGTMIAGLPAHIGFKAISEDGRGADIKGIITDSKGGQVANFQSAHKGMGSFVIDVKAGESYSAKVVLPGGAVKAYPLPVTVSSGIVLQVVNPREGDSVKLTLAASKDIVQKQASYFLVAKARGIVCYAAIVSFQNQKAMHRVIAKSLFPTGITHFILMTDTGIPLNERLVYINQKDNLNINFKTSNAQIAPKDSIALNLAVTDYTGQPVTGNFAISVTDDALIKIDTLQNDNIFTNLLLTSDLKGHVEQPAYYFQKSTTAWQALDNLLLTQGWVNYELPAKGVIYNAEKDYSVTGKVLNVFNKPANRSKVLLFSSKPLLTQDTFTGKDGKFKFQLPFVDTPVYIIKAVNKAGKSFNVGISVEENTAIGFNTVAVPSVNPWYLNSNDTLVNYVKGNIALKREKENIPTGVRLLKQVNITAKKIVKESQNLNGSGNADLVLDEKEVEKQGKKTLLQLFETKIPGFREGYFFFKLKGPHPGFIYGGEDSPWFYINDKAIILIVDGVDPRLLDNNKFSYAEFRHFLTSHSAEDIKGLEVNFTSKYGLSYFSRFLSNPEINIAKQDFAFIEITTRNGSGPNMSNTPGVYLYKPLPLSLPKQFYKPHYNVSDIATTYENRSIVNWEPNVVTDAAGQATIKFNAAAKPSTYTIIAQGIDYNGNIGYHYQKIIIGKPAISNK